jgi:membrane protease YdiL (CAAX protease family)
MAHGVLFGQRESKMTTVSRHNAAYNHSNQLLKILLAAAIIIVPLVAAAWLTPPDFPMLARQILLTGWGVGATLVAQRLLFSEQWATAWMATGFVLPRLRAVWVALLVSLPMWACLPLLAWWRGEPVRLQPGWLALLAGVILLNGITEETLHRGFVFGNLRGQRTFMRAATLSALIFAAQHLYLVFSVGWTAGLASVLLAALLSFPLALLFEHGGNSIAAPAIIHTSSNAPMIIFAFSPAFTTTMLVPYMGIVLVSIYLAFAFRAYLRAAQPVAPAPVAL